ncbi:MAG TPA: hypothetical protein VJS67_01395, partial [Pseudonocardiaceae bacterium]|nr:hypothetical protein [Pseudonocardiaceae bacterium]
MSYRRISCFRRRWQGGVAALRVWSRGRWPRTPGRVLLGRRVISVVMSALMVLATGVVVLVGESAIAGADTASPGLPDVMV